MTAEGRTAVLVRDEVYLTRGANLVTLKSRLTRDAAAALAREVLSHLSDRASAPTTRKDSIVQLSRALISADPTEAPRMIEAQHVAGVTVEALYLGFLAPAARQLGDWWTGSEVTFSDVTVGTGRIYGIMRSLAHHMPRPIVPRERCAFVAAVPGDTLASLYILHS